MAMARKTKKNRTKKGSGRPPETKKGAATKIFKVSPGFSIGGFDGERKFAGDDIELTQAQAKHFVKLKAIVIELGDFDTEVEDAGKTEASTDKKKAGAGNKAEGDGDASSGKDSGTPAL